MRIPGTFTNVTTQAMKAAKKEQRAAFGEIAQELGVENVDEWVETKLQEPASKEARVKLAREKAGPLAPPPRDEVHSRRQTQTTYGSSCLRQKGQEAAAAEANRDRVSRRWRERG